MIDRALVDKIARFAIRAYARDLPSFTTQGETDAVLATVDAFTAADPTDEGQTPPAVVLDRQDQEWENQRLYEKRTAQRIESERQLEAEMEEIDREYLRMNARQAVHHWLKERWAADRIEWRKHMEANSR